MFIAVILQFLDVIELNFKEWHSINYFISSIYSTSTCFYAFNFADICQEYLISEDDFLLTALALNITLKFPFEALISLIGFIKILQSLLRSVYFYF
jgi:hypothetical protein